MLETVNADADRVTRLITELLDISRIDSGRLDHAPPGRSTSAAVVAPARRRHGGARARTRARFQVARRRRLPEMWVDPDKVDQVLGNLLENALRHGAGTVTIEVEPAPATARSVTVTDEGAGIPDEQRDRVFTRFWRSGRRGGTGLGLYIVKGLVEAHGGTIDGRPRPRRRRAVPIRAARRRPPPSPTDATRGAAGPQPSATRGPRSSTLRRHLDSGGDRRADRSTACPHPTSPTTLSR